MMSRSDFLEMMVFTYPTSSGIILLIVEGFGIKCFEIKSESELDTRIDEVLSYEGPAVCTVKIYIGQKILPRQTNYMKENGQMASRPLEDMSPLLDRDEFNSNMIVRR